MDLQYTPEQQQLDDALVTALSRLAGPDRAREMGPKMDLGLLGAFEAAGFLDVGRDAGPVEAVIVVQRAAEALACAPIAARVLAGPLAGIDGLPPAIGLVDGRDGSMVRYAGECEAFVVLDGDRALVAGPDDVKIEPVEPAFGASLGLVTVSRGADQGEGSGDRLRRAWQVALAAEAAGTMLAAVTKTASYVSGRHQFGRPIGSFQAVQHRLARAYVMAQGTRWLSLRAAWFHDEEFLTASAAAYACEASQVTYTNTHQVTGAIGVTTEYGLVLHTMRLMALQRELGGKRAHARRVAAMRRRADLSDLPSPVHSAAGG
jgi:hypothetical protein